MKKALLDGFAVIRQDAERIRIASMWGAGFTLGAMAALGAGFTVHGWIKAVL